MECSETSQSPKSKSFVKGFCRSSYLAKYMTIAKKNNTAILCILRSSKDSSVHLFLIALAANFPVVFHFWFPILAVVFHLLLGCVYAASWLQSRSLIQLCIQLTAQSNLIKHCSHIKDQLTQMVQDGKLWSSTLQCIVKLEMAQVQVGVCCLNVPCISPHRCMWFHIHTHVLTLSWPSAILVDSEGNPPLSL